MLIACEDQGEVQKLKDIVTKEFEIRNVGATKKILGMKINKDRVLAYFLRHKQDT